MIRICSILFLTLLAPSVLAQNYSALESVGTNNMLGNSLYKNATRTALIKLFKNIEHTNWIALDKEIQTLLLAKTDAALIENDIPVKTGEDILTLRLNILLSKGMNTQALELYNKTESLQINEPLARLGTIAMLLNKQTALACLEVKTFINKYKTSSFWSHLNAYCTISLSQEDQPQALEVILNSKNTVIQSIVQSSDYVFEYEANTYTKLNFLQRALLIAEDRVTLSINDLSAYQNIPQSHLGALLNQSKINPRVKLHIAINAAKQGIITERELDRFYKDVSKSDYTIKNEADILNIIQLYSDLSKNWHILNTPSREKINTLLTLAKTHGEASLLPFMSILEKLNLENELGLNNVTALLKTYLYTNRTPPKKWLKQLQTLDNNNTTLAYLLLSNKSQEDLREFIEGKKQQNIRKTNRHTTLINIIENIDNSTNYVDNIMYIYENDFDLINNKRYTLPPYEILMSLKQSSKNQNISMTLLLTALALRADEPKATYWGTLTDSTSALSRTGLNRVSNGILAQAILETE